MIITSPAGGETFKTGETHIISWKADALPAADKIAVTIRRVPPPPLREEGQEFDPIIFAGLPNGGSVSWKISPMYPDGTYVLGVGAYASVPVTNEISAESAEFTIMRPKLSEDLYPLYSGAEWDAPSTETAEISTTTVSGVGAGTVPILNTMDPGSAFSPFEKYYREKLLGLGWKVDNQLEAGGPMGGQTGYRKGDKLILVTFSTVFHDVVPDRPVQCPCDVTLHLFSTE